MLLFYFDKIIVESFFYLCYSLLQNDGPFKNTLMLNVVNKYL